MEAHRFAQQRIYEIPLSAILPVEITRLLIGDGAYLAIHAFQATTDAVVVVRYRHVLRDKTAGDQTFWPANEWPERSDGIQACGRGSGKRARVE
jgi:hypothetical protein